MAVKLEAGSTKRVQNKKPGIERIRLRAFLFGLALTPLAGRWLFEGEMVRYTYMTWAAPFYNAIYVLLLVTLGNMALDRLFGWRPFNRLELLCLYVMVSVASAMMSSDLLGILITTIGYPAHFATPTNDWNRLFHGVLPRWLIVRDPEALKGFYEGNSHFLPQHLDAWLVPLLYWSIFIVALFVAFIAMSVLLRKQWTDSERLTFPIVQLPMAMTQAPQRFFSDRLMWIGLGISGGITLLNGIHFLNPAIPEIPIKRRDFPLFTSPPWNAVSSIRVAFYFFAITLGFLMPLDLSVSAWGFYLLQLLKRVAARSMGFEPFEVLREGDQAFGAYMAIGVFGIWGTRKHIAAAFRTAFFGGDKEYDRDEPTSYRAAFFALAFSLGIMLIFANAAGMAIGAATLYIGILMAVAVVISRIRAEFGFPVNDMTGCNPHDVLTRLAGSEHFTRETLGAFSVFYWTDRVFRSNPMPHQMEGLKLAGEAREAGRGMLLAILIAGLFAIPSCFYIYLANFYEIGAATARAGPWATGYGEEICRMLEGWLKSPGSADSGRWIAMVVGSGTAILLAMIRTRVHGLPIHPLGFAVANSWGMYNLWLPILIGSICKAVILKAGGLKSYRRATMFFFGLMLGEFLVGCSWTIVGMLFGIRTYDFWP